MNTGDRGVMNTRSSGGNAMEKTEGQAAATYPSAE
jgi:hypothetical protein